MKRKEPLMSMLLAVLPLAACAPLLFSCSTEHDDILCTDKSVPAYVEGRENASTRAQNSTLTSFSMYCFDEWNEYTNEMIADGINYSLDPVSKAWSSNMPFYMSDFDAMYAYGVSPSTNISTDNVFRQPEQSFVYTNPTEDQTMLKVASKLYFTKEETNNYLLLMFNDAMYTLFFQAFSGFEDVSVKVKGVTVHNVPNKAKFTFSPSSESVGTWSVTPDNQYVSYAQELSSPVDVNTYDFTDVVDDAFVLFPLQPDEWDFWGGESFADAKARNCCYIEVKLQITEEKDGKTYYLWGYPSEQADESHPEYESIFYPYEQFNCTADWAMRYNGYYYLFLDDNGVDVNGNKIVPHPESGGSSAFKVSSQIDFWLKVEEAMGGTADKWTDDADNNSVEIKM